MIVISNNFGNIPKVPWVTKKTKISTKESFKRILSLGWAPLLSVILFILIVFFYQGDLGSAGGHVYRPIYVVMCGTSIPWETTEDLVRHHVTRCYTSSLHH